MRTLALKKESLGELTPAELSQVVGAAPTTVATVTVASDLISCPTRCPSWHTEEC